MSSLMTYPMTTLLWHQRHLGLMQKTLNSFLFFCHFDLHRFPTTAVNVNNKYYKQSGKISLRVCTVHACVTFRPFKTLFLSSSNITNGMRGGVDWKKTLTVRFHSFLRETTLQTSVVPE